MPAASSPPLADLTIVGHAILSADGMISAADGTMPPQMRNDADWRRFQAALDASALVVVGREGHRRHANPGRRRLVFTSGVAAFAPDPEDARATLFNPRGAALEDVLGALGVTRGTIAVTGGTRVFDYFLPRFSRFVLAEAQLLVLPGGRPCFAGGQPAAVLARAGLRPETFEVIDPAAAVTETVWVR
jgi:hypothetical protein